METKRFFPGMVVRNKHSEITAIVKYDYTYAHGNWNGTTNYHDLSLFILDNDGEIMYSQAWFNADDWELIRMPVQATFDKITEYENKIYNK